ncbi:MULTISPECIES: hypothetical protein [unclassified Sphingomonas]|uniref:hypothetical protein n=1 Tax=unclassified Sphingomonas TaxID=196159 RepID=UPI000E10089E|nr:MULTISPECIES: hypothetical protein [unclassified Sphingomonas]AXJ96707.1 hypothetical protein DM480_15660 [Sphingomonas sp. FARSPH]
MIVDMRADAGSSSHAEHAAIAPHRHADDTLDLIGPDDAWTLEAEPEAAPRRWVLPAAALALSLLWLGGMLWLVRNDIRLLPPVGLVELIAALAVVPALIGILCLLVMRTSRAEARRFGDTARTMRAEAANLERTVGVLARSLDANRRVLAEQITSLMTMGDGANERLLAVGRGLSGEIAAADAHARTLRDAANAAQASVDVLLATLPRAHDEIVDARDQLEASGVTAGRHAAALEGQLAALAERGREADLIAGGAAQRLAAHLARMEATSETAGARLETVTSEMSDAVDALLGRTADAVDEARKGIATQGDAMLAMLRANQAALDSAARDSADALAERIGAVEDVIDRVVTRLERHRAASDDLIVVIDAEIDRVEQRMDVLHTQGIERSQMLAASISALGGSADAMTEALRTGEAMATRTIGTTESLLIALDAASREIDETLPEALTRLDAKIAASKQVVVAAKPELLALVTAAESTHDAIEAIAGVIAEQRRTLDHLSNTLLQTLNEGRGKADALGTMVDETIGRTHRFAEEAAPRLVEALLRVRDTASSAADKARETLAAVIPEAAQALEQASGEAMRRAAGDTVERQVRAIADATEQAVAAATRATERLSDQVQDILDKTALVETRIEDARADREEADRNSFARRASLLIESLNSAAIDVTKAFAPEVSDSAWAAYLKGDRGVFTRRAVRILEPADAREIARLYDDDAVFRETVNRYIHDFEGMLRTILAQRDGSPLGVTLLSSDMGKLYVALAQAIERLR